MIAKKCDKMHLNSILMNDECLTKIQSELTQSPQSGDLIVFTTAEVVIGECQGATFLRYLKHILAKIPDCHLKTLFTREHDPATGFDELKVEARRN